MNINKLTTKGLQFNIIKLQCRGFQNKGIL